MKFKEIEKDSEEVSRKQIALIENTSSKTPENSKWTRDILIQEAMYMQPYNKFWSCIIKFAIILVCCNFPRINLALTLFFFTNGVSI